MLCSERERRYDDVVQWKQGESRIVYDMLCCGETEREKIQDDDMLCRGREREVDVYNDMLLQRKRDRANVDMIKDIYFSKVNR